MFDAFLALATIHMWITKILLVGYVQLQEFQLTTNAALERIDRILNYLLKQKESGEG